MATSVAEGRALVDASERNGVVLRIGTHQRYRKVYGDLKAIIDEGSLGKLGLIRAQFNVPFPSERLPGNWRATRAGSGGVWALKEFGAHLLDLMLWFTGQRAELAGAVLTTIKHPVETDDSAAMLVQLSGGAIGIVDTSAAMHGPAHVIEIYGTNGWVRARDVWRGGGYIERSTPEQPLYGSSADRVDYPGDDPLDPYFAQLADFAGAIAGAPSIGATGGDGLAVLELLEAAWTRGLSSVGIQQRPPA
jgi:predicted dehydrogenase